MIDPQAAFDELVRTYNQEYLRVLESAAEGGSIWLGASLEALRDQYDCILVTHDLNALEFRVPVYPFTFHGNEALLESLGFTGEKIQRILSFLELYRATTGRNLEVTAGNERIE